MAQPTRNISELQRLCIPAMQELLERVFFAKDSDSSQINASLSVSSQQIEDIATSILTDTLQYDIEALARNDPAAQRTSNSEEYVWAAYKGLKAITCYRVANFLLDFDHNGLISPGGFDDEEDDREIVESYLTVKAREISEQAASETTIEINPYAKIKRGFVIDHGVGTSVFSDAEWLAAGLTTVIGETCDIGENVTLLNGVLLGAKVVNQAESGKEGVAFGKRHPTIGDDVTICAGARVLGGITIGDGAFIGPCCVVTDDVPPGYRVSIVNQLQYTKAPKQERQNAIAMDGLVTGPDENTLLLYGANLSKCLLSVVSHENGFHGAVEGVGIELVTRGDNSIQFRVIVQDTKGLEGMNRLSLRADRADEICELFNPRCLNEAIGRQVQNMKGAGDE